MSAFRNASSLLCALAGCLTLVGCSGQRSGSSAVSAGSAGISGRVHGGQQPVGYATIQLYTVGTTGDGSAATPLLTQTVTTDANGNFTLSPGGVPLYSCSGATEVYITATGGDPVGTTPNPNLAMMTAIGPCSALTTGTFLMINELTTVAAVSALAPYMTSITAIGSGTGDASALASAFALSSEYVDPSQGVTPGSNVPAGLAVPADEIRTLANIVAACVNSTGGTAGDSSLCGSLFTLTTSGSTAPTTTIMALLNLANNPMLNTTALFNLSSANAPFQPTLTSAPSDFQIRLVPLSGSPAIAVNPEWVGFGDMAVGFSTPSQTVTISNTGTGAVTLSSISLIGANAGDFSISNSCGSSLATGSSCTVAVTFSPTANGSRAATLQIVSTANGPQDVPLTGIGTAANAGPVTLSASSLSFTVEGAMQDLTLSNYGSIPLAIASVTESDAGSVYSSSNFAITGNTCGNSLPAQSICTISVESITPPLYDNGYPLTYTGTLTINDDASSGPQTVALSSTNVLAIRNSGVPVSANGIAFDPESVGYTAQVTLSGNLGSSYTTGSVGALINGPNAGDFSTAGCNIPIYQGFCSFTMSFTPTGAGARLARFYPHNATEYIPLTGTGVGSGPYFYMSGSPISLSAAYPYDYDPYSLINATKTLSIVNLGTTTVDLVVSFTGANASLMSYSGTGCTSMAPQASCTATISFAPPGIGNFTASVTFKDANSTFQVTLPISASVGYWNVAAFPSYLSFGTQPVGTQSAAQTFVIGDLNKYPLGHAASIMLPLSSNFVLTQGSTCPASTTQTCTLAVAFLPSTAGTFNEVATVTDQVTGLTYSLQLSGVGGSPTVSLSSTSIVFPVRNVGTTSVPAAVTLMNTGTASLIVSGVSVSGAVNSNFTQSNNCTNVAVNGTCTINVTFAPTAAGAQSATVTIVSNASSSPDTIAVSGTAQ